MIFGKSEFVKLLYSTNFFADTSNCSHSFLREFSRFDITTKFSEKTGQRRLEFMSGADESIVDMLEKQSKAKSQAQKAAIYLRIRRVIEKILTAHNYHICPTVDFRF